MTADRPLVFAAPDCPLQGGCPARPVTILLVGRDVSGQLRFATIIFAAEALVPDAVLTGGRVEQGHGPLVPGPAVAATFARWAAPAITALPPSGHGLAADTATPPPAIAAAVLLTLAALAPAALVARRRRRRGA